jgi:hypothetical protein
MSLKDIVLAKLADAKKKGDKTSSSSGRFGDLADLAYKALESNDKDGFEKAFRSAIRVAMAEKEADES